MLRVDAIDALLFRDALDEPKTRAPIHVAARVAELLGLRLEVKRVKL